MLCSLAASQTLLSDVWLNSLTGRMTGGTLWWIRNPLGGGRLSMDWTGLAVKYCYPDQWYRSVTVQQADTTCFHMCPLLSLGVSLHLSQMLLSLWSSVRFEQKKGKEMFGNLGGYICPCMPSWVNIWTLTGFSKNVIIVISLQVFWESSFLSRVKKIFMLREVVN